jgi:hypothetical protein
MGLDKVVIRCVPLLRIQQSLALHEEEDTCVI